jgi:hypothetical protein
VTVFCCQPVGCGKWLDGEECGGHWSWRETVPDGRNSNQCDSEVQENRHMTVGGMKGRGYWVNQNNGREEVIAQRYSMVQIPRAGSHSAALQHGTNTTCRLEQISQYSWVMGRDEVRERERERGE